MYQLAGLQPGAMYEVKVSWPATVRAVSTFLGAVSLVVRM